MNHVVHKIELVGRDDVWGQDVHDVAERSQQHASPDVQAAFFLVWVLPLAAWLSVRVYSLGRPALGHSSGDDRLPVPQETTVSALGRRMLTNPSRGSSARRPT